MTLFSVIQIPKPSQILRGWEQIYINGTDNYPSTTGQKSIQMKGASLEFEHIKPCRAGRESVHMQGASTSETAAYIKYVRIFGRAQQRRRWTDYRPAFISKTIGWVCRDRSSSSHSSWH